MSLYDDTDLERRPGAGGGGTGGWGSSNLKLIQSQMRLKKASTTQPRRDLQRRANVLAPVVNLAAKRDEEPPPSFYLPPQQQQQPVMAETQSVTALLAAPLLAAAGFPMPNVGNMSGAASDSKLLSFGADCEIQNEYNPMKPNDYDQISREMRREKEREREKERRERRSSALSCAGVGGGNNDHEDDAAREEAKKRKPGASGAAIAPPPSLQENTGSPPPARSAAAGAGSIAAMIMAKYGYKEGQGLGKSSQGISRALEVEKTSKRGGRIIHEKDQMPPPPPPPLGAMTAPSGARIGGNLAGDDTRAMPPPPAMPSRDLMPPPPPPPVVSSPAAAAATATAVTAVTDRPPTMAEILREPTKVVMLRNMVGAGEVDEELEAEVHEECSGKYGEVARVTIFEIPGAEDHVAVRIFVEFRRIENAIKALVDLNGRYFGGRQVCARFYQQQLYDQLKLNEHAP